MKTFIDILIKWFETLRAGQKHLHKFADKNKNSTNLFLFAYFYQNHKTLNTKFIPDTYNYGMNYPRSGTL